MSVIDDLERWGSCFSFFLLVGWISNGLLITTSEVCGVF